MTAVSLAATSLSNLPLVLGSRALPVVEYATFAAQWTLTASIYGVTIGFAVVFGFPAGKRYWDEGNTEAALAVVKKYFRAILWTAPVFGIAFWLGGQALTTVLLGERYAGRMIPTACVGVMVMGAVYLVARWKPQYEYRQSAIAKITGSSALLQLVLVALLAPGLGLPGLLMGTAIPFAVQAWAMLKVARAGLGLGGGLLVLGELLVVVAVAIELW